MFPRQKFLVCRIESVLFLLFIMVLNFCYPILMYNCIFSIPEVIRAIIYPYVSRYESEIQIYLKTYRPSHPRMKCNKWTKCWVFHIREGLESSVPLCAKLRHSWKIMYEKEMSIEIEWVKSTCSSWSFQFLSSTSSTVFRFRYNVMRIKLGWYDVLLGNGLICDGHMIPVDPLRMNS